MKKQLVAFKFDSVVDLIAVLNENVVCEYFIQIVPEQSHVWAICRMTWDDVQSFSKNNPNFPLSNIQY